MSTWRKLFIQTVLRFDRDDGMFLASGLAFNVILCLLPFLLILASLWGYYLESSQKAQQDILAFVAQALPAAVDKVQASFKELLDHRGLIGAIGLLALVWTASRLFASIRVIVKITFGMEKNLNYFTGKLFDLGMVALTCLLLFLSLVAMSWMTLIDSWREQWLHLLGQRLDSLKGGIGVGFVYLLSCSLLFLLYRSSLPATVSSRIVLIQALVVGAFWELAKRLFQLYLANLGDLDVLYGSFGVLVMLVLWVQYSAVTFVAGAELGAALYEMRSGKTESTP
ncbi:MAG: YihY/virulence factor BrkB family protein [bacterium]